MAVVTGGLGLPEEGALVAAGLGAAAVDPNAMYATLAGSGAITATLTDGATPEPPAAGGGVPFTITIVPPQPRPATVGVLEAHIGGRSTVTADIVFTIDPEALVAELAQAILLELV